MDDLSRHVIAVFVFIRQDDALLLVRQSYGKRYWSLPGGVVEANETLDQAAIREVKEETGLDIKIQRVVGLYSKPDEGALAITVEGKIIGGSLKPDCEISECGYFEKDNFPEPVREHFHQRLSDYFSNQTSAYFRNQ